MKATPRSPAWLVVGLVAGAGLGPGALHPAELRAQATPWRVASMDVDAVLDTVTGSAEVEARWTLVSAEPGVPLPLDAPIPLELLGFAESSVTEVEHEGARVVLWPTHGTHRAATVQAPPDGSGSSIDLVFSYRAESVLERNGASVRVRIPVLTGPPLAGGEPGAVDVDMLDRAGLGPVGFSVSLSVPDGWRISDGFPTGLGREDDGRLHGRLATAPAMIGVSARVDGVWRPGLPILVDVLALSVLLAFALRGWVHLRGVVAGRREPPVAGAVADIAAGEHTS